MSFMNTLYGHLPSRIQDVAVSIEGARVRRNRYGDPFPRLLEEYRSRDRWSADRIHEYQTMMLARTLELAAQTPFYGALFGRMGVSWHELLDRDAFARIPITTKELLHREPEAFRPRPLRKSDQVIRTSGTTGTSLALAISENVEAEQWAVWWRYREHHGLALGDWCAVFGSAPVVPQRERRRFWRLNRGGHEYRFSVYHISAETAGSYARDLNRLRPRWIHGNPSAISLLGRYMIEQGLTLDDPPARVTVGSENMQPWQVSAITEAFGSVPVQHYGLAEPVANISECEHGSLHTDDDFSLVEYVPSDLHGAHRIVGTSFCNTATVLLRYDTGDLADPAATSACACGRAGRIVRSIDGRSTDYITLPSGRRVASLATPFHSSSGLAEAQVYQTPAGDLVIRYVPGQGWSETVLQEIEEKLRGRIGEDVGIRFEKVDQVQRSARGKIRLVVSDYEPAPAKER